MGNRRDAIAHKNVGDLLMFRLHYESGPVNPRDEDCMGRIVTWQDRLPVGSQDEVVHEGDESAFTPDRGDIVWALRAYETQCSWKVWVEPYRPGQWRANQVGFMVVTAQKLEEVGLRPDQADQIERNVAAEARQYENYLSGHVYRVEAHRMVDGDVLETPVSIFGDIHLDDDYWNCWGAIDEVAADMLPHAQPYSDGIDVDMVKVVEWAS